MARRYRNGDTLKEIGCDYGISRERVRQRLRRIGVSTNEGGMAKRARDRKKKKVTDANREFVCKHGMTKERFDEIQKRLDAHGATPWKRYIHQRKSAGYRGIGWNFNFASWWALWEKSGKWEKRGCGKDCYAMCRIGDTGPYEPSNVEIKTNAENNSEFINRYWKEVSTGDRPPHRVSKTQRTSKYGLHKLAVGDSLVITDPDINRGYPHRYAKDKGWKVTLKNTEEGMWVKRIK